MKILVTGGVGYIGSHACVELLQLGHNLMVIDNFSNSHFHTLESMRSISSKEFLFEELDIRNRKSLDKIMKSFSPEVVIHFAGLKAVQESMKDPISYYEANVNGAISLILAMQKANVKKMIFSSSATVYGKPKYLPYDESHPTEPINAYGKSKLFIEEILSDWAACDPLRKVVCLRYFNPVGAHKSLLIGENPKGIPNNLLPVITQNAIGMKNNFKIYGDDYATKDGTCERDYIHVCDLVDAHIVALSRLELLGSVVKINIGVGKSESVMDIIRTYEKVNNCKINYAITKRREGDLPAFYADNKKAKELLHWEPKRTISEICKSAHDFANQTKAKLS